MAKYALRKKKTVALSAVESINYSVAMRQNPQHENDPRKAYASLQYAGTVQLEQLAQHILSHGSPYTRDMIVGVATALVDCTREYVTRGFKVDLGDLGTFRITIAQMGANSREEFTSENINDAWVEYTPSGYFVDLSTEIQWNKVSSRKVQAAALKAENEGKTAADWSTTAEDENGGD